MDDDERRRVRSGSRTSSKAGKTSVFKASSRSRLVAEVGRLHWMASFKEIRELLLQFSVENNTINEEELFLLSEGFKSVNRLSHEKAWIESIENQTVQSWFCCHIHFTGINCRRHDFRTVPFIYLIRIDDSIHVDQVYRKQYIRNIVKVLLSRGRHIHFKTYKQKKKCGWKCFERFSLGFLTGLFHARVPSINAFSFSS